MVRSVRPSIAYIPSWSISDQSACEWLHRDQRTRCNHTACSTLLLFYHLALMDWNVSAHGLERLRRGTYAGHRYTSSRCVASIRRGKRVRWCAAAAVQHNARTRSGPPSTRASIAMDGGVADTARANTTVLTQAINRQSFGEEKASVSDALALCTLPCTPSCSYDRVRRNIRCFKLLVTLSGFGPHYQGYTREVFSRGSYKFSAHRRPAPHVSHLIGPSLVNLRLR